jgi:argininosuccinate lyase
MNLLTVLKGLPLTYNRDLQEDKEPLFDSLDTVTLGLRVLAAMLPTLTFNSERMRTAALENFAAATDLADALVKKGLPFRDAHEMVGKAVAYCEKHGQRFEDLSAGDWAKAFGNPKALDLITPRECAEAIRLETVLKARNVLGGTAPAQVARQIARWKKQIG